MISWERERPKRTPLKNLTGNGKNRNLIWGWTGQRGGGWGWRGSPPTKPQPRCLTGRLYTAGLFLIHNEIQLSVMRKQQQSRQNCACGFPLILLKSHDSPILVLENRTGCKQRTVHFLFTHVLHVWQVVMLTRTHTHAHTRTIFITTTS